METGVKQLLNNEKPMLDPDTIKIFANQMADHFEEEEIALYKKLHTGKESRIENPWDFFHQLIFPFNRYLSGLILCSITKNSDAAFLLKKIDFLENHLERLFVRIEGSPFSSDKTRTVINLLFKWFTEKKEMNLCPRSEDQYWLPKKILTTHMQIIDFYRGLVALYYGNPDKYIKQLQVCLGGNHDKN